MTTSSETWKMTGLHPAQFILTYQASGKGSTFTVTNACESGLREAVKKNSSDSRNVRTLCKEGRLKDALQILNQPGIQADCKTYIDLLQACIRTKALGQGQQVHAHIIRSGFRPNIFLVNSIINMYGKCGSMVDARKVFDRMPERDTFTWAALVAGYAKHGHAQQAFTIYEQMQWEGSKPVKIIFICILNACASLGALDKGKRVHRDIIKSGIVLDIYMETTLVDMYAKCGSIKDACQVFDKMTKRNVVSWNAMIAGYVEHGCGEVFKIFEQMRQEGVTPDPVTFICMLKACARLRALEKGKEFHVEIIKAGIVSYINLENTLVDMYAKCGSIEDALKVFDNMTTRDVVSWNAMIGGYIQRGSGKEAIEMYEQMQQDRVPPNSVTFICILRACASLGAVEKGREVHVKIMKAEIVSHINLENALIDMYAKCGSIVEARQMFDRMAERDVVSWNSMITGYNQHGCGKEAFEIYEQMQQEEVVPNRVTFICILNTCGTFGALEKGKEVHTHIRNVGITSHITLETALVSMYAKCGSMKDAHQVFDTMAQRDVISWTAMITGYAQHGFGREVFEMYEQMQQEGVTPNSVTFICVLNVCACLGALEKGKKVHADISKNSSVLDIILETSLVDMYTKCGSMNDARRVFDSMAQKDVISWNAMITGYAQHGFGREALQLFEQMHKEGLKPNSVTFMSLLSACSHVGLADEGHHYFNSMSRDHNLIPTVEHFGCMVDLLGRAGRLDEAESLINRMQIMADTCIWKALLSACQIHGDVAVAERAAGSILQSD